MKYYIAYGSNLHVRQMKCRCPGATPICKTQLNGWRLAFRGSRSSAYLTIEPDETKSVPVVVWAVTQEDEFNLDCYEGYPDFYYKRDFRVQVNGGEVDAFAYIMHENNPVGKPSAYYWEICKAGYRYFDLDLSVLLEAYERSYTE